MLKLNSLGKKQIFYIQLLSFWEITTSISWQDHISLIGGQQVSYIVNNRGGISGQRIINSHLQKSFEPSHFVMEASMQKKMST